MVIFVPEAPVEPEGKPAGLHLTSPSDPGGSPQAHIGFEFICVCPAPSKVPGGLFLTVSCLCSSELPHTGCVLADNDPLSPGSFRDLRDLSLSPAHGAQSFAPLGMCTQQEDHCKRGIQVFVCQY